MFMFAALTFTALQLARADTVCRQEDAPALPAHASVTWTSGLTSLTGDLTCDEDYIWTTDDDRLVCDAGTWSSINGKCRQRHWTNPYPGGKFFKIPRAVNVGWRMCFSGTPDTQGFSVNLFDAQNDRPLKISFMLEDAGKTKFTSKLGGTWTNLQTVTSPPFPLTASQPFFITLEATAQFDIAVSVNGALYHTQTLPVNVNTITKVVFYQAVTVTDLDLWCLPGSAQP